jgi:hypothetical protein
MPETVASSLPNPASYTVNGDGTVHDNVTGLTWQRTLTTTTFSWADAKTYCTNLSDNGGGWRLPSIIELVSIVDYNLSNPAIDPTAFPGTPNSVFWSSSEKMTGVTGSAWYVVFDRGQSTQNPVGNLSRVRCVRSLRTGFTLTF